MAGALCFWYDTCGVMLLVGQFFDVSQLLPLIQGPAMPVYLENLSDSLSVRAWRQETAEKRCICKHILEGDREK